MPYYAKRKRTYGTRTRSARRYPAKGYRRTPGRSTRKGYRKISIGRSVWQNPLPNQRKFAFTYHDMGFPLNPQIANSYVFSRLYRGNSLYDPDYTGVGVQPYGYDNMCNANAPFGRYLVYGSKITVYPHVYTAGQSPQYGTGNYALKMVVVPTRIVAPAYTSFDDITKMPYARARNIESANDVNRGNILKQYVSTRRIMPEVGSLQDDALTALYNTNPTKEWYWLVIADSSTFSNDITVYAEVKIKYYCKLMKTDDLNES